MYYLVYLNIFGYAGFRHRLEHVLERANTYCGVAIRSNRIHTDGATPIEEILITRAFCLYCKQCENLLHVWED